MMYSVNEANGTEKFTLFLARSSSTDTIVKVYNNDGSAIGEYCSILINYVYIKIIMVYD